MHHSPSGELTRSSDTGPQSDHPIHQLLLYDRIAMARELNHILTGVAPGSWHPENQYLINQYLTVYRTAEASPALSPWSPAWAQKLHDHPSLGPTQAKNCDRTSAPS
jgi:hypothetical protein